MVLEKVAPISKTVLAIFVALIFGQAAYAGTPAEIAAKWGILGTWMTDCALPPGPQNLVSIYSVKNGQLSFDRIVDGDTYSDVVTNTTAHSDGTLSLVIDFHRFHLTNENLLAKGRDGRIRVMQNHNLTDNTFPVKNGVLVSNGVATPWMTHCVGAAGR